MHLLRILLQIFRFAKLTVLQEEYLLFPQTMLLLLLSSQTAKTLAEDYYLSQPYMKLLPILKGNKEGLYRYKI